MIGNLFDQCGKFVVLRSKTTKPVIASAIARSNPVITSEKSWIASRYRARNDGGFSLFELLITLSIISFLAIISFPSFTKLFQKNTADALSAELITAIQFARQESITLGEKIILCKSDNNKICSGEWRDGFIVKSQDEVLQIFESISNEGSLFWRAKLGMADLEFFPDGFSKDENGTFWYCEKNAENPVWAIALNQLARARKILPNRDGEILDGKGQRLRC